MELRRRATLRRVFRARRLPLSIRHALTCLLRQIIRRTIRPFNPFPPLNPPSRFRLALGNNRLKISLRHGLPFAFLRHIRVFRGIRKVRGLRG